MGFSKFDSELSVQTARLAEHLQVTAAAFTTCSLDELGFVLFSCLCPQLL